MTSQKAITMKPVGTVKTTAIGDEVKDKNRTSEIVLNPELTPALQGITEYSHAFILFWLNQVTAEQRKILKIHPRGRKDLPLRGIFAVRTNLRPNPIGLTLVELIKVEDNVLTVRGLDAFNGTPVLDIKPFDSWDAVENAKVPKWWLKLEEEKRQSPKA